MNPALEMPDFCDTAAEEVLRRTLRTNCPWHSLRVARWGLACAGEMGLSRKDRVLVYLGGLFHDLGKVAVGREVLLKPGPLTADEWERIKEHPVQGAGVLASAGWPPEVVRAVRHHHEDYCGSGYPDGLRGEEIPLFARILRVADAYDAMTSKRPYKKPYSHRRAVFELVNGAGREFDPEVVKAFLEVLRLSDSLYRKYGPKTAEAYLKSFLA